MYLLYYIIIFIFRRNKINTKLVIFDLDGTLCDTFDDIYLSLKYSLDYFSINSPSLDEVKSFIGDGLLKLVERTLNFTNKIELKDDIMSLFMSYYEKHCTDSTLLFSGMEYVIQELYSRNINMAIVSNKTEYLVKIIMNDLDVYHYFKYIYGGDSFSDKKPNPIALNQILLDLSIKPSEALMVGDNDNDILAGQYANISTCFCSYGYSKLEKSKSNYIIDSPIELLDIC